MSYIHPAWVEHQRQRWLKPDWQRWVRHDAHRFLLPNPDERKSYAARRIEQRQLEEKQARAAEQDALRDDFERLRWLVRDLKVDLALRQLRFKAGFNPDQPRDELGRWTDGGGQANGALRLAASDKPPIGPAAFTVVVGRAARKLIEAFRTENGLRDLFGNRDGTVSLTTIDGKEIYGSNSTSPTYTSVDRAEATKMRDTLLEKYPDVMQTENVGRRPNDARFHAETTALLRAARENGGSLADRTMEVFVDNPMCASCGRILPLVGRELGNPTVTFEWPAGVRRTMQDGVWNK